MIDKEIIDDYKKMIHNLQTECREKTNDIIQLGEQLQCKEQEYKKCKSNYELYIQNQETIKNIYKLVNSKLIKFIEYSKEHRIKKTEEANRYKQALEKVKDYCNYVYLTSEYGNADYTVASAIEVIINEVKNEH